MPSEISWRVPIGAVLLLGWMLPGKMFMLNGLGGKSWSLLYAAVGLLAVFAVLFRGEDAW
jgi:hypothetical protein